MKLSRYLLVPLHLLILGSVSPGVSAQNARIEIISQTDLLGGREFGLAGPYEKLQGKLLFAVDPNDLSQRSVVDIEKAPVNAEGRVEFTADVFILKPKDTTRGNGVILFDVVNRGNKGALSQYNRADGSNDPSTEDEMGDGFIMRHGFTIIWIGWQFDIVRTSERMGLDAPNALDDGEPIAGLVRYWFRPNTRTLDYPIAARGSIPYPVLVPDSDVHLLSVRQGLLDDRQHIPREMWRFGRDVDGEFVPDPAHLHLETGFEPGLFYEVVYNTETHGVAGLGYLAVRDGISHLRYETDLLGTIEAAYASGTSQSGRFLRGFVYHGFNEDQEGRYVFDGVLDYVAGAVHSGFNRRFVQPSITEPARFPFSDIDQYDPVTGQTDGLLTRAKASGVLPKIFHINSSNEYWTAWKAAALVHTTIDAEQDIAMMDNVRLYILSGTQHGSGGFPPTVSSGSQNLINPNNHSWIRRSLLLAMDSWVRNGVPPPPSIYPLLADGTLVSPEEYAFPDIPGVNVPQEIVGAFRFNDGPRFSEGIPDIVPRLLGEPFPVRVPQVDSDGNEIAGIRFPEIEVPLATYTGWNLRDPSIGAPNEMVRLIGSYIPLPLTRADREMSGDPRLSIEERYQDRNQYLGLYTRAALRLVTERLVLAEDLPLLLNRATLMWDYAHGGER